MINLLNKVFTTKPNTTTYTPLQEALRSKIKIISEQIYNLKKTAIKSEPAMKTGWTKDGVPTEYTQEAYDKKLLKYGEFHYTKITEHINPKHSDWKLYLQLKRNVSNLLTALRIVKIFKGKAPEDKTKLKDVIKQVKQHCKKSRNIFKAYKYAKKLENKLSKVPTI